MNFYEMKEFIEITLPDLEEEHVYKLLYAFEENEVEVRAMLGGDYGDTGLGSTGTPEA